MNIFNFVIILFVFVTSCNGNADEEAYKNVKELYDDIIETHHRNIEPRLQNSVFITKTLDALVELDEVDEKLSTVATFIMRWNDKSMSWNETIYNVSTIHFGDDVVWKPIMELGNPHNSRASTCHSTAPAMVYYTSEGNAHLWRTESLDTRCNVDTTYFPFDKQLCEIRMKFPFQRYEIYFYDADVHLKITGNSNWKISKYQIWVEMAFRAKEYVFRYSLDRKPTSAIINLILPVFVLASLTPMVFVLPKDAGDRLGLSLTTLLAISVYMTIIADTLPEASDPLPIITIIMFIWYISNTGIIMLVLLNARLYRISDTRTVPLLLRRFVKFTRRCSCRVHLFNTDTDEASPMVTDEEFELTNNECGLVSDENKAGTDTCKTDSRKAESEETHPDDVEENVICWRHVSSALDKWFIIGIYSLKLCLVVVISIVFKYGQTQTDPDILAQTRTDPDEITDERNFLYWVYE